MRVERPGTVGPVAPARRTQGAAGGFDVPSEAPVRTGAPAATTPAGPVFGVDALLAMQGAPDPSERRRRQLRRADDMLDGLDRLKIALLEGRLPAANATRLLHQLMDRPEADEDPRLMALVREIEVRAAVELAKLEHAQ